jgi:epoxide hydrolase A/B
MQEEASHDRRRDWRRLSSSATCYVTGDRDLVVRFPGMEQLIANLSTFVPRLRPTIVLPGCGHWTQQERAREVNEATLGFLEAI